MHGNPVSAWLDAAGRFFNPKPQLQRVPLMPGHDAVVIDNALANPEGVRDWAAGQAFGPPIGYPYPGHVCAVPEEMEYRIADFFAQHLRQHLGARRTLDLVSRLSVIDTPPAQLAPVQWLCHRDRVADEGSGLLFAASVLYLFDDAALGGTSFYRPRESMAAAEVVVAASQRLDAHEFASRYNLQPGYMAGSNAIFERTAQVPAAWNRLIFYDGGQFHSADVDPARLEADPMRGRLTLNSFITCRKNAH